MNVIHLFHFSVSLLLGSCFSKFLLIFLVLFNGHIDNQVLLKIFIVLLLFVCTDCLILMSKYFFLISFCVFFGLSITELNAQDFNDEMKKRLRQSIIMPEKLPERQPLQHTPQLLSKEDNNVLKVSPFTKLPTRGDRIKILHPPEEYKINISMTVTNSTPINQLPRGSVRYEFVGKNMQIISTAGNMVVPSGNGGPIRKRHKKNANILKALEK